MRASRGYTANATPKRSAAMKYRRQTNSVMDGSRQGFHLPTQDRMRLQQSVPDSNRLNPGDEVVTSGAQLLLSEELKFQIRNENED